MSIVGEHTSACDEEHHALVDPGSSRSPSGSWGVRLGSGLIVLGLLALLAAIEGQQEGRVVLGLVGFGAIACGAAGTFVAVWSQRFAASNNHGVFFRSAQSQGIVAWALAVGMTGFYVILYWFPERLERMTHLLDPVATLLAGRAADHWFLYGFVYTIAVLVFGLRMLVKHRGNPYQLWRTASLMAFQLGFAFLLPHLMELARQPEFYFTYFWPLKWSYVFPSGVSELRGHPGGLGVFLLVWSAVASLVATPVLTYYFGKRWYCSWVCGCGGLAETLGDPLRHLSSKSSTAWRIERVSIYAVLGFIVLTTALVWTHASGHAPWLGGAGRRLSDWYGFFIGSVFSGVVGVGFYPLLGSRVWCRFGCPMAAVMGLQQRLWSRFRITTNGGQCISCGNCSTYCEMGIDVRAYAQKGENIVRASCVGCGVCSAVCPRGVLNLENGRTHGDRMVGHQGPWTRLLAEPPFKSTDAERPQHRKRHS